MSSCYVIPVMSECTFCQYTNVTLKIDITMSFVYWHKKKKIAELSFLLNTKWGITICYTIHVPLDIKTKTKN